MIVDNRSYTTRAVATWLFLITDWTLLTIPCPIVERTTENADAEQESEVKPEHRNVDYPKIRVLVAEDNLVNQKVVLHALKKYNCVATLAQNGQEAVSAFQVGEFDLVLLDCHMPLMSGFDAARIIRTLKGGADIPIIALTALAMDGDRQLCIDAGMNDYLAKPFNPKDLYSIIRRWLALEPAGSIEPNPNEAPN